MMASVEQNIRMQENSIGKLLTLFHERKPCILKIPKSVIVLINQGKQIFFLRNCLHFFHHGLSNSCEGILVLNCIVFVTCGRTKTKKVRYSTNLKEKFQNGYKKSLHKCSDLNLQYNAFLFY